MPTVPIAVSIADILEVRGGPLREREVWALLCQSAAAVQDFFIKGASSKADDTPFVISPTTLTVCRDGQVNLTPGCSIWHGTDFSAPEFCSDNAHMLSETAIEKVLLFTLGKTLQVATEYGLCKNEYVSVSHHLDSLLEAMCEENPAVRVGLRSILEACDLHTRQHPEKTPYAQTICHLYSSVLGSVHQTGLGSSFSSDTSQQRTLTLRSRRRPRLPHHPYQERHSGPSRSPSPTPNARSRSRSHSREGTADFGDGIQSSAAGAGQKHSEETDPSTAVVVGHSSPPSQSLTAVTTTTGILTTITTTSSCGTLPTRRPLSSHDLNVSFASSAGDPTSLYHAAPAYQAYPTIPPGPLSLHMGSPAYEKYLQLKERCRRLKAAKVGKEAEVGGVGYEGMSTPYSMPSPYGPWQGEMMDYMTDSRSLASLMSYNFGNYVPELASLDSQPAAPVAHGEGDGGSVLSSDLSLLGHDLPQPELKQHNQPKELKQPHVEASSCLKRRREDDISEEQQKRQSDRYPQEGSKSDWHASQPPPPPAWSEQAPTSHLQPAETTQQHLQRMHQFGSRDLTPTPDTLPPKEFYGPEFVYRASLPMIKISLPLQGESAKNPALARRIIIIHLTGQKLEAIVDPCMTGRQLFDAVVTHTALDDFFFFGLTYVSEGEHFFLDADTKLHKMSPEGWREGAKGHMPPVTFTLFLRVKFYPDSLADFRHLSSQHLLYLQVRRDMLEERCMADDKQLLALSGLALHAEFGDYSHRKMGHNYFVPEQYLPARVARRLGMGYVHDRALEAHRDALGLAPSQCEIQFVKMVQMLPEYGIHFYKLMKSKNDTSDLIWVGLTQSSLLIAQQSGPQRMVTQALSWPAIMKISFNKRRFSVQPKVDPSAHAKGKPPKISFFTNSYRKGKYLLQLSTAQHRFHIRMRTRAAALENLGGHEELEDMLSASFSPATHRAGVERGREIEEEEEEEGEQQLLTAPVEESGSEPAETASVDSPGQLASPGTDSRSSLEPEDRPEVPPLKYRSPPPYHPNLDGLMKEMSAGACVHAPNTALVTAAAAAAASSDMHASSNLATKHGTEQSSMHYDAASLVPDHTSSPPLSPQLAADSSSPDHPAQIHHPPSHHHERPASHLASGQPSVGRHVLEVTLQKEGDKGIGITIVGGETTSSLDLGIFVKSVLKDGPAARMGQIRAGDRLIAINGVSLEGVQHHEAVQLIRDSAGSVRLLLSQMHPPLTVRRKLSGSKARIDVDDDDAVCHSDEDDLESTYPVLPGHLSGIPSAEHTTATSQSHHYHHLPAHPSHLHPGHSDFIDSGSVEPGNISLSECFALPDSHNDSLNSDVGDEVLLSEEMLAATDLDSQSRSSEYGSRTNNADAEFGKETQELQILGDIANMTVDNSDTDSDFESAVQATLEGKVTRSSSNRTSDKPNPLRRGISVSSPDTVIYEMVLEKEQGSLGILVSEEEKNKGQGRLYVQSLVPGGPAESGGILQPGDCLLELNGQSLSNVTRPSLEHVLQYAPDVCLLKVARTKSLDDRAHHQPKEQSHRGQGRAHPKPDTATTIPGDPASEGLGGPDIRISPPSAFASTAPVRDIPPIPVVPPPSPLNLDSLRVEEECSNNTQSDVDSDVLDSSRSELEQIYKSAEKYLDDSLGDLELDAAAEAASMNVSADGNMFGSPSYTQGETVDGGSYGGHWDTTVGDVSPTETVKNASPSTVLSMDLARPLTKKWPSESLVQREPVTEGVQKGTQKAAEERVPDTDQVEVFSMTLTKSAGGGLGFTVVGGASTTGGCYVKAVLQDPALSDGRLRAGDRLIQVNGQDMTGLSHFEAVTFLRNTPKEVMIEVEREPHASPQTPMTPSHRSRNTGLPDHTQQDMGVRTQEKRHEHLKKKSRDVEHDENSSESVADQQQASAQQQQQLVKAPSKTVDTPKAIIRPYTYGQHPCPTPSKAKDTGQPEDETNTGVMQIFLEKSHLRDSLGFSLVQHRTDCGQTGIFINTLTPGGIAHNDGRLRIGDRLIQVNGESLIGCSHTKAVRLLRESAGTVVLTISRSSEWQPDSNDAESSAIPSRDTIHHSNNDETRHPTSKSSTCSSDCVCDDDINDILDEAINFLDRQCEEDTGGGVHLGDDSHTPRGVREESRLDEREADLTPRAIQTDPHPRSTPVTPTHCPPSTSSPVREIAGPSNVMDSNREEAERKLSSCVRKVSSVEIPEDLSVASLLSLPVLRMRRGTEERTVKVLQLLSDAIEQEEPLLEFEKLRQMKATDNMEVAKLVENKCRNRYRNVLPYDCNRVRLQTLGLEGNDYINASDVRLCVKGREDPLCYIACQGPLAGTQGHFWQMVWEAGSNVVVMLTQETESGKVKCHRYWPQAPDQPLHLAEGYTVQLRREETVGDFEVRHLRLYSQDSGEEREVVQLHYTTWPDHGVPDTAYPMLQFVRLMHQLHRSGPFVVHCSAGIGRSGVLIAVDTALTHIETGDDVDLFDIVSEMRHQRYGMIQTQDQYLFCYTACMEALLTVER
ncbi:hypothetical protein ACOMHN_065764 [Nucella lapillus]